MTRIAQYFIMLSTVISLHSQNPEAPSWPDYTTKRANGDSKNSILLDYSYAGYHHSEKPIPDVSTWNTISVTDYGATPNDEAFDDAGIRAAINAAEASAVPTVVYFPSGRYKISDENTFDTPIDISGSHIVLKGAGTGPSGTEIYAEKMGDVSKRWNNSWNFQFTPTTQSGSTLSEITNRINRGDTKIVVKDASAMSVGMPIVISQDTGTENIPFNIPNLTIQPEWTKINETGMRITEKHTITAINGNTITLKKQVNAFVTADLSRATVSRYSHIEEVGVEDILFTSGWKEHPEDFQHHKNDIVDYAWRALRFENVRNGWIRNVEFRDWNESLHINGSMAVTVEDVKFSGKQGHVSSQLSWSTDVLVQNCEDLVSKQTQSRGGQWHGPGLQLRSTGCVYLNFKMQHHQFVDFHGYQPYGNLFDNIQGGILDRNGGALISRPHCGPDQCFWNFEQNSDYTNRTYDFWDLSRNTQNYFVHPKFVGFTSPNASISFKNVGLNELQGSQVYPKSLFDAQLQLRLYDGYMSASSEKEAFKAINANDDKPETAWESETAGVNQWLMLDLGVPTLFNNLIISETSSGVKNWKLEYWSGSEWKIITAGEKIGIEKMINFDAVKTRKIRFTVESMLKGKESAPVSFTSFEVANVDSNDSDNDGVPNSNDSCPDTEAGTQVDDLGCPLLELASDNFTIVA
ncbi:MAG: DUF4955 domain-containing protein, partial [Maribacter sp.]